MVSNLNLLESRRRILLTTPHLESPTPANPLTFKSNMTTKLKEGKVYFTPIQEGEGDPSPDNVRPILGWDGITLTRVGKNLLDGVWRAGRYIDGAWSETNTWRTSNLIPVKANESYCVSANNESTPMKIYQYLVDSDGNWISGGYGSGVIQTTSDTAFLAVCNTNTIIKRSSDIQLELGSTPTTYEPYTETQITIPFPKTIYGGYVDLVNGEVVEEWGVLDLGEVNWGTLSGNRAKIINFVSKYNTIEPEYHSVPLAIAEKYVGRSASTVLKFSEFAIMKNLTLYYDGENNPSGKIAYPLATPIHHTIDPQVIRPLKGVNNIYSDANGNIEIKFWKH